jgi:uncharacterized protein (TIGR03083 family)
MDGRIMNIVKPIHTVELFPGLSQELLAALRSLRPADWAQPTACAPWTVKDVAAHLLGGSLGRLWQSEALAPSQTGHYLDYQALVNMINQNNDLWVRGAQRISPEILIEFLKLTDHRLYEYFSSLDPDQPARIGVAWAGDSLSPNWFDIAREYTEKWLHQQHIREAVGLPVLQDRKWLFPVLDTFLRGLPHAYRGVEARERTAIIVEIVGDAGGEWTLLREEQAWHLYSGGEAQADCQVRIGQETAWRLFTRGMSSGTARPLVTIIGDEKLGSQVFQMVSIMA